MTYTHEQIAALVDRLQTVYGRFPITEWGYDDQNDNVIDSKYDIVVKDVPPELGEFIAAAPGIAAQLLARVVELEAENELLRQGRDGLLALGVHAAPFIEPTNRQLSNLLEGIRAEQREVDDD